jgi:hypothetical protein
MTRRCFLPASAAPAAWLASNAQTLPAPAILELRQILLRNSMDDQSRRTNEFLEKSHLPALARAGAGPVGCFSASIASDSPYLLLVAQYASVAGWEQAQAKLAADADYQKAADRYHMLPGMSYVRVKTSLLRGFRTMPVIEIPPQDKQRPPRVFELRTYESNNPMTLARKIRMFEEGEIALFRRLNMTPVFFGETLVGDRMPNLTYMLCYDSLAMREKVWNDFRKDPEWIKMSAMPGYSNNEIVSNISAVLLAPTGYSPIR